MELFSTWKDIVDLVPQLWDKENRKLISSKTKQDLMAGILAADNAIKGELEGIFEDFSAVVAWFKPPVSDPDNHNSEACLLSGITLNSLAKTEVVTLTFNNASAYAAFGDFSGALGTGSRYSDFTCTTLNIPASAWYGNFQAGDLVYIRTYLSDPTIADAVSAPLAASNVLDSIYTDQIPNSVDTSNKYRQQAMRYIGRLRSQEAGLQKHPIEVDLTPEAVNYTITDAGEDTTEYLD